MFKRLLGRKDDEEPGDERLEDLKADFKARYHSFRLLLNANSSALETMTEMEEALRGLRPFGMHFIRAAATRVCTSVFTLVRHLDDLAPGRHPRLMERFGDIRAEINTLLGLSPADQDGPLTVRLHDLDRGSTDQAGAKMANLGEIASGLGCRVPAGFVVTSRAQRQFLAHEGLQESIDAMIQGMPHEEPDELQRLSSAIQQRIINAPLPGDVASEIRTRCQEMAEERGEELRLAVRSSSLAEDGGESSFAGQYRTVLNVWLENVCEVYKEVVASKYSPQAMAYRLHRGIPDDAASMAVGCLEMVRSRSGGVAYSVDPLDPGSESLTIDAAWGLARAVVDGGGGADVFRVHRREGRVTGRHVAEKTHRYVCRADEGVIREPLPPDLAREPSLTEEQILELARVTMELERHFGQPQDVEWAFDHAGQLLILQSRPVTALERSRARGPAPEDVRGAARLLSGGVTASPGAACGEVRLVLRDADALSFPKGAILVLRQPLPRRAVLLSRASAVIAEEGGAAGHLANVAREFGIPAVFGLQDALRKLRNGQLVTLDADRGAVYDGRCEVLLRRAAPQRTLMEGTLVHERLRQVAELILPLNLLAPEDVDFRVRNCKTLHDITRFCHQKAVEEMFSLSKGDGFPERAAKQLVTPQSPMQFWIINLDDGFRKEVRDPTVRLSNIRSVPMLALWTGMMAIPWEGPPPVNAGGFLSVMFEATMNPHLDPASDTKYRVRNYFMISHNFCSLQSRFGFHFCLVEALVSERHTQNYVAFRFKGGAADSMRRTARARFVADILERFDFRCDIREDSLTARVKDAGREFMEERLKVLGYMVIHTRQIDMIMADPPAVARARRKMLADLREIVPGISDSSE
ncbi:pyruvate, water dikinase [Paucidesulfovibrio gracilis DSM 16080]|uniref:Phosphoenolpyruvate synthase n=1 Tax=Paucidesulfovibrio gracilis DSM 16080 TaxID=1121449 RepID=A0A1T4Y3W4_9BACT|nr:pyruvate, water dikinase [Paucidesulfovibrio gracilis DSM 16080]